MLDGLKFTFKVPNLNKWQESTGIELFSNVSRQSGEVKQYAKKDEKDEKKYSRSKRQYDDGTQIYKQWGNLNSYFIEAIEKIVGDKSSFRINVRGSLHKGSERNNHERYHWNELQEHLFCLPEALDTSANSMIIQNIEFGVLMELDQPVKQFLDTSLISLNGKPFKEYDKDRYGHSIGYYCECTEYEYKLYDKSLQNDIKNRHIFRVEKAVNKMRAIAKHDIKTVSDLSNQNKVNSLSESLLASWDKVILIDPMMVSKVNDDHIQSNLKDYANPKYWERIKVSPDKKRYHLEKLKLIQNMNGDHLHTELKKRIYDEWCTCFLVTRNPVFSPLVKNDSYPVLSPFVTDEENCTLPRVLPVRIIGENRDTNVIALKVKKPRIRKKGTKTACIQNGRYINFIQQNRLGANNVKVD